MKRLEDSRVRQAGRIVSAAARQAMAWEKARITGRKPRQLSALEQEAVEWEAKAKKTEEER